MEPCLYLIPAPISDKSPETIISKEVERVIYDIQYLVVENIRTARRIIRRIAQDKNIDEITFLILDEHTKPEEIHVLMDPIRKGQSLGIMSEAGLPAVADPGAQLVSLAHKEGFKVIPLPGPSSILLALSASGLNGQHFAFNGYLPVKSFERKREIKRMEESVFKEKRSQIFMETPYRNIPLLNDVLNTCHPQLKLCIAADITGENEFIKTLTVSDWKKKLPDIHKTPAIFILGAE